MYTRLLRFFARRPLTLLAAGAAAVLGGAFGIAALAQTPDEEAQGNPRMILGRGWYDSYPRKRTDVYKFFVFFGGGVGIYEEGSVYRYSIDVFELERQNDKLWMKFF